MALSIVALSIAALPGREIWSGSENTLQFPVKGGEVGAHQVRTEYKKAQRYSPPAVEEIKADTENVDEHLAEHAAGIQSATSDEPTTAENFIPDGDKRSLETVNLDTPAIRSCYRDCISPYGVAMKSDPSEEPAYTFAGTSASRNQRPVREPISSAPVVKIPSATSAPLMTPTSDAPPGRAVN